MEDAMWEPHSECANDHWCGVCGSHHHWEDGCPDEYDEDDE